VLKFLLVVAIFAALTYLAVRAMQRSGQAPGLPRPRPRRQPPRIIAPDDDEDFLRDLERKRRHPEDPESPSPG